jgi:hypothetical protein
MVYFRAALVRIPSSRFDKELALPVACASHLFQVFGLLEPTVNYDFATQCSIMRSFASYFSQPPTRWLNNVEGEHLVKIGYLSHSGTSPPAVCTMQLSEIVQSTLLSWIHKVFARSGKLKLGLPPSRPSVSISYNGHCSIACKCTPYFFSLPLLSM